MIQVELPGGMTIRLNHLVSDFNGTLAVDGKLVEGVAQRLVQLAGSLSITVLTSDTVGTAAAELRELPVVFERVPKGNAPGEEAEAKRAFIHSLDGVVFLGNGANDFGAVDASTISIVVLGQEGAAGGTLMKASLVVTSPVDALDLLLHPLRLVCGLRR